MSSDNYVGAAPARIQCLNCGRELATPVLPIWALQGLKRLASFGWAEELRQRLGWPAFLLVFPIFLVLRLAVLLLSLPFLLLLMLPWLGQKPRCPGCGGNQWSKPILNPHARPGMGPC